MAIHHIKYEMPKNPTGAGKLNQLSCTCWYLAYKSPGINKLYHH